MNEKGVNRDDHRLLNSKELLDHVDEGQQEIKWLLEAAGVLDFAHKAVDSVGLYPLENGPVGDCS